MRKKLDHVVRRLQFSFGHTISIYMDKFAIVCLFFVWINVSYIFIVILIDCWILIITMLQMWARPKRFNQKNKNKNQIMCVFDSGKFHGKSFSYFIRFLSSTIKRWHILCVSEKQKKTHSQLFISILYDWWWQDEIRMTRCCQKVLHFNPTTNKKGSPIKRNRKRKNCVQTSN